MAFLDYIELNFCTFNSTIVKCDFSKSDRSPSHCMGLFDCFASNGVDLPLSRHTCPSPRWCQENSKEPAFPKLPSLSAFLDLSLLSASFLAVLVAFLFLLVAGVVRRRRSKCIVDNDAVKQLL